MMLISVGSVMSKRVGNEVIDDGVLFEVMWDGGEGLVGPRPTKPNPFAYIPSPPETRLYNKTGRHVGEFNKYRKPKCVVKMAKYLLKEKCAHGTFGCVVQHEELDNIRAALDSLEARGEGHLGDIDYGEE